MSQPQSDAHLWMTTEIIEISASGINIVAHKAPNGVAVEFSIHSPYSLQRVLVNHPELRDLQKMLNRHFRKEAARWKARREEQL